MDDNEIYIEVSSKQSPRMTEPSRELLIQSNKDVFSRKRSVALQSPLPKIMSHRSDAASMLLIEPSFKLSEGVLKKLNT